VRPARGRYPGKRALDLVILSLAAIPAMTIGAISAIAILADDGRPVLFRQVRAGRDGRPFVLLKLRTMATLSQPDDAFPEPASITRTGRLLRRLSIDELPQLINVLRGDMSLVGPRPTLPYQVRRYDSRQLRRLSVPPGLTGLAQVNGRNRMSWGERIEWDLRYVDQLSLRLDLAVLARTVRAILTGDGVTGHPRRDPIAQDAEGGVQCRKLRHVSGWRNPISERRRSRRSARCSPAARSPAVSRTPRSSGSSPAGTVPRTA
jgi:lipopolysaccharide/colanic/teichoic acid biosynthesis glycosyltransferase